MAQEPKDNVIPLSKEGKRCFQATSLSGMATG